jgi:hypothetical protein
LLNPPPPQYLCVCYVISSSVCNHFVLQQFLFVFLFTLQQCYLILFFPFSRGRLTFSASLHFKVPSLTIVSHFSRPCYNALYTDLSPILDSYFTRRHTRHRLLKRMTGGSIPDFVHRLTTVPLQTAVGTEIAHLFMVTPFTVTCLCPHQNRLTKCPCLPAVIYRRVNIHAFLPLSIVMWSSFGLVKCTVDISLICQLGVLVRNALLTP